MSEAPEFAVDTEPLQEMSCPHCEAVIDVSKAPSFSKIKCTSCGREVTVGARFGEFRLLDLLGSGGMGSVFKARDETLGRLVAIKVMLRSLGDDPVFSETFKREAQAAAKLNHSHIAQIYSFGQQAGQPYIVMELVPGKSLDALINEGRSLSPVFVISLGADIADGLRMAAAVDLVHGDIKPENILMDEQGQGKLVDFGIATVSEKNEDEIWGTPYYISPEKIRRQKIDLRTDIYSLGATLYHALAGRPPFEGENAIEVIKARFNAPPTPLSEIRSDLDPPVDQIIERMLQIEPTRRYPTYESLLSDMQRYLEKNGAAKTTSSISSQFGGSRRVVVKKKPKAIRLGGGAAAGSSPAAQKDDASPAADSEPGEDKTPAASPESAPAPTSAPSKKRKRKRFPIVLAGIALLLLLSGGAVYLTMFRDPPDPEKTAAQERSERYEALRQEWEGIHNQAEDMVAQARTAATTSSNMLGQVSNVFATTFSEDMVWEEPRESRIEEISRVQMMNAMQSITSSAAGIPEQALAVIESGESIAETGAHFEESSRKAVTTIPEQWLSAAQQARDTASEKIEKATEAYRRLQTSLESIGKDFEKLEKEPEILAVEREKAAELARQEAERKRREEEKVRQEARRQAKIRAEIERIRDVEDAQREKIQQHRFQEIPWPLRDLEDEIETTEGRRELENARERLRRIESLFTFLKEQLAEKGFRRGWIQNNIVEDIEGATDRVIRLPDRVVPWHEVEIAAVVRLIHHFLVRGPVAEDQSLRVRSNQLLNAALYSLMMGRGNPSAEQLAGQLLDQAQRLLPLIEDDIKRLLPEHHQADEYR